MSALITTPIPTQAFELVRDQIGAILKLELENQKQLQDMPETIEVYQERLAPMQTEEELYLNVLLDSGQYESFTGTSTQGTTRFLVDIYTTGVADAGNDGSVVSGRRLGKYIGLVRAILSSVQYKKLGFAPGMIGGVYVESFATADPQRAEDSNFTRFGRLSVAVRILENNPEWQGTPLVLSMTTVKLEESEKGYRWETTP